MPIPSPNVSTNQLDCPTPAVPGVRLRALAGFLAILCLLALPGCSSTQQRESVHGQQVEQTKQVEQASESGSWILSILTDLPLLMQIMGAVLVAGSVLGVVLIVSKVWTVMRIGEPIAVGAVGMALFPLAAAYRIIETPLTWMFVTAIVGSILAGAWYVGDSFGVWTWIYNKVKDLNG